MNNKPVELFLIGGIAGFLGSLLTIASSYVILFQIQNAYLDEPVKKMAFIAQTPLVGITHGLCVVSLLLLLPTVLAVCVLFSTISSVSSLLGTIFALLWIVIELVGQLSQTAPLRALSELYSQNPETALAIFGVLEEFSEAFTLTGTFLAVLMSLSFGLILIGKRNRLAGALFLLACVAFPIGLLLPHVGVQAHVILRALAFLIISGVLIQIATTEDDSRERE